MVYPQRAVIRIVVMRIRGGSLLAATRVGAISGDTEACPKRCPAWEYMLQPGIDRAGHVVPSACEREWRHWRGCLVEHVVIRKSRGIDVGCSRYSSYWPEVVPSARGVSKAERNVSVDCLTITKQDLLKLHDALCSCCNPQDTRIDTKPATLHKALFQP